MATNVESMFYTREKDRDLYKILVEQSEDYPVA